MKSLRIRLTPEAARLLSKLHPDSKKLIKSALQELRQAPYSGHNLQEELSGFKSYRSKRYRILYRVNEEEQGIEVYYIGHRKDIYEQFKRLLNQLTEVP
jgi:mRNA-degrading endonuclease RelE of RelBE toxin-antitoxin system